MGPPIAVGDRESVLRVARDGALAGSGVAAAYDADAVQIAQPSVAAGA